jgi:hypothetical protein
VFWGEGRNLPLCGWKNFSPICNKLDFRYHCRGGEREAEVAISLFKVVDATPGQEPLPLTLYSIPSNPVTQGQIFLRKDVPNNLVADTGKYISEK